MLKAKIIVLLGGLLFAHLSFSQQPLSYPKNSSGLSEPELNFEIIWQTFEDNYAFFDLREIDWKQVYRDYRPKVSASTSDDSLFAIVSQMLAPFQDDHINVIVPGKKQFKARKPSLFATEFPTDSLRSAFWKMAETTAPANGLGRLKYIGPLYNGKPLFSYSTNEKMGYLRFNRCFVDGNAANVPDAVVAGKLLDSLFTHFNGLKGLIVDVRDNIGGNDEFAYEVADRFVTRKQVGSYKKTRKRAGGYEELINEETWWLEPKGKKPFTAPVIVLTNDKTASAGDLFALLMKQLPQVRIIGTNTRGIFSDMYGFTLPNKWMLSLSNQRYYNDEMICFEGAGVPVDVEIHNTRKNLIEKADPVLEAAVSMLRNKNPANQIRKPSGTLVPIQLLDKMLQDAIDSFNIPGMAVAFIDDGKIIHEKTFGYADLAAKKQVDRQTMFETCSMSKPVFAYFVMKMVDKGIINLDTPLYKYASYPELEYDNRYKLITARMVLSHTTGLPNWHQYEPPDSSLHVPAGAQYFRFPPGTQFSYSGEAYQYLVNVMIKLLHTTPTGLADVVHRELFVPMGIRHARFGWNDYIANHKSFGYRQNEKGINKQGELKKFEEFSAAGGLHSDAADYARFMIGTMKGTGLTSTSLKEMLRRHVYLSDSTSAWTLGFSVYKTKYGDLFFHSGNNGDFTCSMAFNKDKKCGYVILTNNNRAGYIEDKILPLFK